VKKSFFLPKGFTLIELLIVVAIIAILAAIAVPNFLEAQVRAKVSRTKSDMRTLVTGLEAYAVDHNAYPNPHRFGTALFAEDPSSNPTAFRILERLSTPIAYVTSVGSDPFKIKGRIGPARASLFPAANITLLADPNADAAVRFNSYIYQGFNSEQRFTNPPDGFSNPALNRRATAYILHSAGPDGIYHNLGGVISNDRAVDLGATLGLIYDPTNGTVSFGSVYRSGGSIGSSPSYAGGEGLLLAIRAQRD
jgi:type II secretion system protein G